MQEAQQRDDGSLKEARETRPKTRKKLFKTSKQNRKPDGDGQAVLRASRTDDLPLGPTPEPLGLQDPGPKGRFQEPPEGRNWSSTKYQRSGGF